MTTERMHEVPWTRAEVDAILPKLKASMEECCVGHEHEVKPLPPMTTHESRDYLLRLMDIAAKRPLTFAECFLHGQLLAVYEHAVKAEMLGKKGQRYFVISEDQINERLRAEGIR